MIADLVGKGGHVRTVPIPAWVKHHVDAWTTAAAITRGPVFRAINKAGRVWGDGIAFRGCPVCWVFGLFERASQGFASSARKEAP